LFSMRLRAVPSRLVPGASGASLCFHVECGLVDVHTATQIWTLSLAFNNVAKLPDFQLCFHGFQVYGSKDAQRAACACYYKINLGKKMALLLRPILHSLHCHGALTTIVHLMRCPVAKNSLLEKSKLFFPSNF
jgi:hypothetical protein